MTGHFGFSAAVSAMPPRSEEHTSELQSQSNLVCRHLLEQTIHHAPFRRLHSDAVAPTAYICMLSAFMSNRQPCPAASLGYPRIGSSCVRRPSADTPHYQP